MFMLFLQLENKHLYTMINLLKIFLLLLFTTFTAGLLHSQSRMSFNIPGCPPPDNSGGGDEDNDPKSITEHKAEVGIFLYPNPVESQLRIEAPIYEHIEFAEVFSVAGNLLKTASSFRGNELHLNVEELPAGIYLIHVRTDQSIYRSKIVKH